jgi:hypothetical protein
MTYEQKEINRLSKDNVYKCSLNIRDSFGNSTNRLAITNYQLDRIAEILNTPKNLKTHI